MNEALMRCVVEAAAFFATVSDDVLNPDVAVEQLEQLSYFLKRLEHGERELFERYIKKLYDEELRAGAPAVRLEFLESAFANLGLSD